MNVLIADWGRRPAGLYADFVTAINELGTHTAYVTYEMTSDVAHRMRDLEGRTLPVRTFKSRKGAVLGAPRLLVLIARLVSFLHKNEVSIVVVAMESIWLMPAIAVARAFSRFRLITIIHDAAPHPGEGSMLFGVMRRMTLRVSDDTIVLSRSVSDQLGPAQRRQKHHRPMHILRHPSYSFDTCIDSRDAPAGRTPVVGFFGRILDYKGLALLLESVSHLATAGGAVCLHVVGDGALDPYYELIAATPNLVIDNRWVDPDEIEHIVSGFDVLALPYLEASQSGVIGIAMGLGVPVVATPMAGLREQIQETQCGVVSYETSPYSFAEAIRRLLDNDALYKACSAAGLREARGRYSVVAVTQELVQIFDSNVER
ncbi:MAG: glycosyltransferase family 4 protein [Jatrophihabitans sp.]